MENITYPIEFDANGIRLAWSGETPIPAVGDIVSIRMNGFGKVRVLSHFASDGGKPGDGVETYFIGFTAEILNPPQWYIEQNNGENPSGAFFGIDIEA